PTERTPGSRCSAKTRCHCPHHKLSPVTGPRETNHPWQLRDLQDPEQRTTQTWRSTPRAPRACSCTSRSSSRQPRASVCLPRGERLNELRRDSGPIQEHFARNLGMAIGGTRGTPTRSRASRERACPLTRQATCVFPGKDGSSSSPR